MKKLTLTCLVLALLSLTAIPANGQIFDEAALGDFSGDSAAPTSLGTLLTGVNSIIGTSTTGPGDNDLVTFSIAAGQQVTSLEIIEFDPSAGVGSFFGFDNDNIASANAGDFLFAGLVNVTAGSAPIELLGGGGGSFGGQGVPTTLGAGDYVVFFNETGPVDANYQLNISVVPEPGSLALLAAGFGMLLTRRKR